MKPLSLPVQLAGFALILALVTHAPAQASSTTSSNEAPVPAKDPWAFSLVTDGYLIPDDVSYANPNFMADHRWLHLEARYNSENLSTGSLWFGYNFAVGKKLVLNATPMIGGVFGRTNGIAPGCEATLTYKKVQASISNEYVFDLGGKSGSFYYTWPQITYSPVDWFNVGVVAQRNRTYHTTLDTQRGLFAGLSHKNTTFTTYVFNFGWTTPTVVLELGLNY